MSLNPKQIEAVNHIEGPLLVLAGAGSGKTRVVTQRIAHLIELGTPASEILAVTFTNKAAGEMKHRVQLLTSSKVMCLTFHSLGARILREKITSLGYTKDFTIYDEEDTNKLVKECLLELHIKGEKGTIRTYKSAISSFKNDLIEPHQLHLDTLEDKLTFNVYQMYLEKLKRCNAVDFDDLLFLTVKLLKEDPQARSELQSRWQFLLVDEYQDTNTSQYELTKILSAKHKNLFVVGDPDQSIYSWRGAQFQNILNFDKDYPNARIINLEQNYRSTNIILKASNAVIQNNEKRYEKNLWSELGEGEKIKLISLEDDKTEAKYVVSKILTYQRINNIPLNQMVIFYRTNAQSRAFEDELLSKRVPYLVIGGLSFYQRREIKDALAFLKVIYSNNDLIAFLRTINLPKRGIGEKSLEKITKASQDSQKGILSFCCDLIQDPTNKFISPKQKEGLKDYIQNILSLRSQVTTLSLSQLLDKTLSSMGYYDYLKLDQESYEDRKENLDQLIAKADEFENNSLESFLEEVSLKSTADTSANTPSVNLMTIHHGKGLEFPVVFITGLEEELFPHARSKYDPESLEEERRLFYVGMTRAKSFLYVTSSQTRYVFGAYKWMSPSRFIREIPPQYIEQNGASTQPEHTGAFLSGDRVVHKDFGIGIVQKGYETCMGKTYEVYFENDNTTKTLVAKYAKLTPYLPSHFSLS